MIKFVDPLACYDVSPEFMTLRMKKTYMTRESWLTFLMFSGPCPAREYPAYDRIWQIGSLRIGWMVSGLHFLTYWWLNSGEPSTLMSLSAVPRLREVLKLFV